MDKLIDAFCKWEPFGQGIFLFLLACMLVSGVVQVVKLFVVFFRGWPVECCDEDECCESCGKKGDA